MANYNMNNATTTNFTGTVPDFIVNAKALDTVNVGDETYHYFDYATTNFGYYFSIPEIYSAANSLCTWAFGAGWTAEDPQTKVELESVIGMGKDTFDKIIWNHALVKLIVGDAFIEIKRKKNGGILNMIPISPERVRVVLGKNGLIKRYDVWNGKGWRPIEIQNMLHSQNKRIGDQIHGTSQIDAAKFIIDARNEALADERVIKHRDKALGIAYYKTNNTGKISYMNSQIEKAVKNGEMLGVPEDGVKIEPYPSRSSEDRQSWISYLENFFYQVFGVPRSIATSDGTSEVGGKMGNVNFEPTYAKERFEMENDLWQQQAIKITFEKQASLAGLQKDTMAKNTGQTSIQNNDVEASMTRE